MTVKEIVEDYLKKNGYDGLFYPGECACTLENLMFCGEVNNPCEAGVFIDCEEAGMSKDDFDFCIGPKLVEREKEIK